MEASKMGVFVTLPPSLLNDFADAIYTQNKEVGWWDDPNRCLFETIQLVSTEIAEATEGERKNLMDDKIKHRKMGEVELADAKIRILDIGGHLGLEVTDDIVYVGMWDPWIHYGANVSKMHLGINRCLVDFANEVERYLETKAAGGLTTALTAEYARCVYSIMYAAEIMGYDVFNAMIEKLDFNKTRPDHKRENRAKEHGKKF